MYGSRTGRHDPVGVAKKGEWCALETDAETGGRQERNVVVRVTHGPDALER